MYKTTLSFKDNRSKATTITAVFAGLFAIGNFVSIPEIGSLEMLVTWVCAGLFGPHVAVIAAVIGETLILAIFPTNPLFIPTKLGGAVITALVMGYGRTLAFGFGGTPAGEKRRRAIVESIFYVVMLAARLLLYLVYNLAIGIAGYEIVLTVNFLFKVAFLPVGLLLVESIRKGTGKVYFDIELVEQK